MPIQQLPVGSQLPPDLAGQLAQIQMRQQLSQALLGQSMQPINPARSSGRYIIPISPLEGLSHLTTSALLSKGLIDATKDSSSIYSAANERRNEASDRAWLGGGSGQPQTTYETDPTGAPGVNVVPGSETQQPTGQRSAVETPQEIYRQARIVAPAYGIDVNTLLGEGAWKVRLEASLRRQDPSETARMLAEVGQTPNSPTGKMAYENKFNPLQSMREGSGGVKTDPATGKPYFAIFSPKLGQGQSMDQQGNVQVAPGYMGAQEQTGSLEAQLAGLKAAEEARQKLPFELQTVKTASGAEVPMPKANFIPQPGASRLPQQSPNAPVQNVAPPTIRAPSQSLQAPPYARQDPALMSRAVPQQGEIQGKPIADPWQTMPRMQTPQGIGQSTFQEGLAKHQADKSAELSGKYGDIAAQANQRKAYNDQALELVDRADTGFGAAKTADVKNILLKVVPGLKESSFENTPSATIALQKDLVNAATQKISQQIKAGGGRITQSEIMLWLSKGAPNADMPKAAIKYLIASDSAQANYQMQQANDLGRYLKNGGDPMEFDRWYAKEFPLTKALAGVHPGLGQSQPNGSPAKQIQRTGTLNGRKVIQYSDGTTEYAN